MSGSSAPFDASSSALGYIHQCRCALLLALQRDDAPELSLSIEKFDDVAVHDAGSATGTVIELRQHKLHLTRQGNLGDKSPDVWKTLRVWCEATLNNQIDLDRAHLCLVTTSQASDQNSIRWLRPTPHPRNSEEARQKLEQAGASSTNDVVVQAHKTLLRLTEPHRQKLFRAAFLLDGGLDANAVRPAIRRCVWSACVEKHRDALVERLEGWWINLVVEHLGKPTPVPIPIHVVQQKVHEIGAHFRRDTLPDDLLGERSRRGRSPPRTRRTSSAS